MSLLEQLSNALMQSTDPLGLFRQATSIIKSISANEPATIQFTAIVAGGVSPYTYAWTFGDGGTATGNPVTHTYGSAGTFPITVIVTDSIGNKASGSDTAIITIPVLVTITPTSGGAGTTFTVNGSGFPISVNVGGIILYGPNLTFVETINGFTLPDGTFIIGIPYNTTYGPGTYYVLFTQTFGVIPDLIYTQT